ncbi:TonB-dependent receptor [Acinetobacter sp. TR11]|uniref:TonB-dependent receptor n=1 Tax=Acinetobacter sp. TR11 TaxID=3003393 RepID=UPI0022AC5062|nr:TonB-dependent receptor [Acinetobacter sp. TR11]WAU74969.1 TonB-dependent receptor [Acinetobacter sp. TR11]
MKVRSLSTSFTLLSLAISTQLYAQTVETAPSTQAVVVESQKIAQLAPIVVTATRSAQSIAEIAGTVYSINKEDIAKQAAAGKSTADILGLLVPSLTPSSGTTSNYGMTMRGRTVQYMIDGVPQTGSRDSSRQLNSISPDSIEKIEVVSGASSIYGSGATGGIINIITKKGTEEGLSFESKVGVTSGDNFKNDALAYEAYQSVAFNQGDWNGFLGAGYTKRGEIQDSHGHRIGPEIAQTDRQDTETIDVNGRLSWQLTDKQKLSFGAQYYDDQQDSEYGPDYGPDYAVFKKGSAPSLNALKGFEVDKQPFTKRYAVNAQYQNTDLLGQELNVEAYYRNENARFYPTVLSNFMRSNYYLAYQSESDIDVTGVRAAMTSKLNIINRDLKLTYGIDYDHEKDKQTADLYSMANNGLKYNNTGRSYDFGPDATIKNLGTFIQANYDVTDALNLQTGIRYQRIESDTGAFKPTVAAIQGDITGQPAGIVAAGSVKHDKTLFNLGAVYKLNDQQQVFANFSQGFSLPDIQRVLRDVSAGYVVRSENVDPITVNNYELGWRMQNDHGANLGLTSFYNTSDKVIQFKADRSMTVADTDQRVYGLEVNASMPVLDQFNVGGTLSYTRGQFKDAAGTWRELNALQVSPIKGTVFGEWNDDKGNGLRVQMLAVKGTDKAYEDALVAKYDTNVRPNAATKIKGYAVMDVIANAKAGPGTVGFGVYNVWNTEYKTVFSQAAEAVYSAMSSLPAQGRTYGLSYTLKY